MVDISKKTYENNDTGVIVDRIGTLWLNEKHREKNQLIEICKSSQTNMIQYIKSTDMNQQITQKSNQTRFLSSDLALNVTMDCRTDKS